MGAWNKSEIDARNDNILNEERFRMRTLRCHHGVQGSGYIWMQEGEEKNGGLVNSTENSCETKKHPRGEAAQDLRSNQCVAGRTKKELCLWVAVAWKDL